MTEENIALEHRRHTHGMVDGVGGHEVILVNVNELEADGYDRPPDAVSTKDLYWFSPATKTVVCKKGDEQYSFEKTVPGT